jgi:NAD(P)H-hydrate repair Nnr-like enzyme with NAD(P)H-hydrate dehydratase domain
MVIGTVPYQGFPLVRAECSVLDGKLRLAATSIPVLRGTPALLAAACMVADFFGHKAPVALVAGDTGRGEGSRQVYAHLVETLEDVSESALVFHYLQPEVDWHNRILIKLDALNPRPLLIADAGYMYVAKMSGFASSYDLFTPDVGELAFLADESAPHPFYTRGFLLQEEDNARMLIERAYRNDDAARYLLVKGRIDLLADRTGVLGEVSEPSTEAMEPIGGTGDSLTGILAGLIRSGLDLPDAALTAALANRFLGELTSPTPASSIADLIRAIPQALERALSYSTVHKEPPRIVSR